MCQNGTRKSKAEQTQINKNKTNFQMESMSHP